MKNVLFLSFLFFLPAVVSAQHAELPEFVMAPPGIDECRALRELARSPEQWAECRKHVDAVHVADHVVHRHFPDDRELAELFASFRKMEIPIHLEVGAVKPWGKTGQETFQKQLPMWKRFEKLGADLRGIAMDEPLNCCDTHLKMTGTFEGALEYAATETAEFIALVRGEYPDWIVGDTEGFPALSVDQILQWIDTLEAKLKAKGVRGLDFFRLDVDRMHFVHDTGKGRWRDVKRIETHCRSKKIPFSFICWAAGYPSLDKRGLATDRVWYVGAMQMYFDYLSVHGMPEQMVVQSWVAGPKTILPESEPFSFVRSVLDIAEHWKRVQTSEPRRKPYSTATSCDNRTNGTSTGSFVFASSTGSALTRRKERCGGAGSFGPRGIQQAVRAAKRLVP